MRYSLEELINAVESYVDAKVRLMTDGMVEDRDQDIRTEMQRVQARASKNSTAAQRYEEVVDMLCDVIIELSAAQANDSRDIDDIPF